MIAEGLLGKIYMLSWTNKPELYYDRLGEIRDLASRAFYDGWKPERASKKLDKHYENLRGC